MSKRILGVAGVVLAGVTAAGIGGCGVIDPTPRLPASAFVANQPNIGAGAGQGVDHGGPLVYDAFHRPQREVSEGTHISDTVREAVKAPGEEGVTTNAGTDFPPPSPFAGTGPTTQGSKGVTTGQFQVVGSVVAQVDAEPIFADKVLRELEKTFRAEAANKSEQSFREFAEDQIGKQVREFVYNDLEYAAARTAMEKKDEQIAKFVTGEWRKEQVRKAGGSEAKARQLAADNGRGIDFDELVHEQFRLNMTRLYYQNKLFPKIQVSANDIRQYYQTHLRQFQSPSAAKFRVIWIGSEATGGKEAALDKARMVYQRAEAGEDFAELASKFNSDKGLHDTKGAVGNKEGWMEKGEFASDVVDEAVWKLQPKQVTPPLPEKSYRGQQGFWVVKLEDIKPGRMEPFESPKVQDEIRETLRREQFARLRDEHRNELMRNAVYTEVPGARQVMLEMVMQRYHVWVAMKQLDARGGFIQNCLTGQRVFLSKEGLRGES